MLDEDSVRDALRDPATLATGEAALEIRRNGTTRTLSLDQAQVAAILARDVSFTQDLTGPLRIQVVEGGPLEEVGMLDGDHIVALNSTPLDDFLALKKLIDDHPEHVDYTVSFLRAGEPQEVSVRARSLALNDFGLAPTTHEIVHDLGFLAAMKAGVDSSINSIRNTGLTLAKLFTGEVGTENLGGPIAISVITYEAAKWDFAKLLMFLAALSVNLGLINILPIPVLDGGQIVFLMCEKVKGSRLSERFMQNAQLAGFVAILALMVYVTFNDFATFF